MFLFEAFSTFVLAGGTGSGKTHWTMKLLRNIREMFPAEYPVVRCIYCYAIWQDDYDVIESELPFVSFHQGLPGEDVINALTEERKHTMVILDDLMSEVSKSAYIASLFTRGAHHLKCSVLNIVQNLFPKSSHSRTMNLNSQYTICMKSPRAMQQIKTLAIQLEGNSNICEAYRDVCQERFAYLIIDTHPNSEPKYSLRTRVFPGESETVIYMRKNQS